FQAEDGIRDLIVTGVQTCAIPIWRAGAAADPRRRSRAGDAAGDARRVRDGDRAPSRSVARAACLAPAHRAARRGAAAARAALDGVGRRARGRGRRRPARESRTRAFLSTPRRRRSEEHTSELQSRSDLVCRLLLEKKKKKKKQHVIERKIYSDLYSLT